MTIEDKKAALITNQVERAARLDKHAKETNSLAKMNTYMTLANKARAQASEFAKCSDSLIERFYNDLKN
jgi:hypothetical protein